MALNILHPGKITETTKATQAEAVAGVDNRKYMTPLRTKQVVDVVVDDVVDQALPAAIDAAIAQASPVFDDVLSVETLPQPGESGKLYIIGSIAYHWNGTDYDQIGLSSTDELSEGTTNLYFTEARAAAAAPVQSVAGKTGAVTLSKSDVGLDKVDNTPDAEKPVSTPVQEALSAETLARTAADDALSDRIDYLTENLDPAAIDSVAEAAAAIGTLSSSIEAESQARTAADSALQTGVHSKYQLPAPDIFLRPWRAFTIDEVPDFPAAPLQTLANGAPGPAITLRTAAFTGRLPFCRALDLPAELLAARRLFLEFVVLRGRKQFVPSAHYADGSWPLPWPRTFWTRAGEHFASGAALATTRFTITRPNHLEIPAPGALLPAWSCLNGRLALRPIFYSTSSGQLPIDLPCPAYAAQGKPKASQPYLEGYHLLRFAFRYVLWDPAANAGRGQIIPGPLSRQFVLRHHTFPFRIDHYASSLAGEPRCTLAEGFDPSLMTVDFAK